LYCRNVLGSQLANCEESLPSFSRSSWRSEIRECSPLFFTATFLEFFFRPLLNPPLPPLPIPETINWVFSLASPRCPFSRVLSSPFPGLRCCQFPQVSFPFAGSPFVPPLSPPPQIPFFFRTLFRSASLPPLPPRQFVLTPLVPRTSSFFPVDSLSFSRFLLPTVTPQPLLLLLVLFLMGGLRSHCSAFGPLSPKILPFLLTSSVFPVFFPVSFVRLFPGHQLPPFSSPV